MSMGRSNVPAAYNNRIIGGYSKMKKNKDFIAKAVGDNKGSFKAKAKKAGETTAAYAQEKKKAPGKLGKQARLAITLMKLSKKK